MRLRLALVALVLSFAVPARADSTGDKLTAALGKLATAASCSNKASPWRPWCIAATGWAGGKVGELPKGKVLLGITIELEDGKDTAKQLGDAVGLSAWAIDGDGKLKVTYVTPSNEDEKKPIAEALFDLSSQMKGKTASAAIPKDLAGYVGGLKGAYAATKGKTEWTWQGKSAARARQVGAYWVVVETPDAGNGFFVTVFTPAWASE
ncbi:MAG TPA: hypothetical protein VGF94_28965 [Kofleriaceae bacterium]